MISHLLAILFGCLLMGIGIFVWIELVLKPVTFGIMRGIFDILAWISVAVGAILVVYSIGSIYLLIQLAERGL